MEAGFVRNSTSARAGNGSQEATGNDGPSSEVLIVPQQLCSGHNHNSFTQHVVHMPMAPLHFSAVSTPPLTPSVSAVISCSSSSVDPDLEQADNQSVFKLDSKSNGSVVGPVGPKRTKVWVENSGTVFI